MDQISQWNLSNLKFALILACDTGDEDDPPNTTSSNAQNFLEQVICGVQTAVGFKGIVYVIDCNLFASDFVQKMVTDGSSVSQAKQYFVTNPNYGFCSQEFYEQIVIAGNQNTTLR